MAYAQACPKKTIVTRWLSNIILEIDPLDVIKIIADYLGGDAAMIITSNGSSLLYMPSINQLDMEFENGDESDQMDRHKSSVFVKFASLPGAGKYIDYELKTLGLCTQYSLRHISLKCIGTNTERVDNCEMANMSDEKLARIRPRAFARLTNVFASIPGILYDKERDSSIAIAKEKDTLLRLFSDYSSDTAYKSCVPLATTTHLWFFGGLDYNKPVTMRRPPYLCRSTIIDEHIAVQRPNMLCPIVNDSISCSFGSSFFYSGSEIIMVFTSKSGICTLQKFDIATDTWSLLRFPLSYEIDYLKNACFGRRNDVGC